MRDLNLLYVFEALWHDRSVTAAAERLGVTQAAVSNALRRMREEHADRLFVQVSRKMEPTPRAVALAPQFLEALTIVRRSGDAPLQFDPSVSARQFTIRMRDVGEVVLLPKILGALSVTAPGVRIRMVHDAVDDTAAGLAAGRIDLALGHTPTLDSGTRSRLVMHDRYVCVMRPGHHLACGDLSFGAFIESEHLLVEDASVGYSLIERALVDAGARSRIRVRVPQYLSAPALVTSSNLLWCLPETLARALEPHYGLPMKDIPVSVPDFDVSVYWHERYHQDPANVWMRNFIASLFQPRYQSA